MATIIPPRKPWITALLLVVPLPVDAETAAGWSEKGFRSYVKEYESPQLLENNGQAFAARLKLLDQAPKGSSAKILTFVFDNGEVVRRLASHACLAAKRGVKVEVVADSKSGSRVGERDVFDKDENMKVNEETYQYMANCGVQVCVHNQLNNFDSLFGMAIPKITAEHDPNARQPAAASITVANELRKTAQDFVEVIKEEIASEEFHTNHEGERRTLKLDKAQLDGLESDLIQALGATLVLHHKRGEPLTWWESALKLAARAPGLRNQKVLEMLDHPEKAPEVFDEALLSISRKISSFTKEQVDPRDITDLTESLKKRFSERPRLVRLYEGIRRFNRLNHRKLFMVESPGGEACTVVGGRNLGNHYLADHHDSFMDGDVLYCRHHGKSSNDIVNDTKASFDGLLHSQRDDVLGRERDSAMNCLKPRPGYQFRHLATPVGALHDGISSRYQTPYSKEQLPKEDRSILDPLVWKDSHAVKGIGLPEAKNFQLHSVAWEPKQENDPVRQALLKGICNETEEIYIETAYAEFDEAMQKELVAALERGVNVRVVTNGIFITDGPSKAIRLFMALSMKELMQKYPGKAPGKGKFDVKFATLEGGHMIHFKGAGFRCQKHDPARCGPPVKDQVGAMSKARGGLSKTFLIGSHNFHPRSGYSDKEHALQWDQDPNSSCLQRHGLKASGPDKADMLDHRDAFYQRKQAELDGHIVTFPDGLQAYCEDHALPNKLGMNVEELMGVLREKHQVPGTKRQVLASYPSLYDELKRVAELPHFPEEKRRRARTLMKAFFHSDGRPRSAEHQRAFLHLLREGGVRDFLGIVL